MSKKELDPDYAHLRRFAAQQQEIIDEKPREPKQVAPTEPEPSKDSFERILSKYKERKRP